MKSYKIFLTFFLLISSTIKSFCQAKDSTEKYIFGWQLATGAMQSDFSALHKYSYLLNKPSNINFNYPSPVIFIGNPKKNFVSIPFGYAFSGQHTGTYNGYNISSSGGQSYLGINISFPLATHFEMKTLNGIYFSAGGKYLSADVTSKATGINPAMHDTTFYFEASHAKTFIANVEIMFELFNLEKKLKTARMPIVLAIGYNLQFQKPQWTGTYYRNVGDENPNINLGGFYCRIGFNFWTSKHFWKGMFKTQKDLTQKSMDK